MALMPFRNHWWHVTLYVSARGLTTGPMPLAGGRTAEIEFDLVDHELRVRASDGRSASFPLRDRLACAHFYRDLFGALGEVGVDVEIHPEPYDLGDSPAFPHDTDHDSYDAHAVERWWAILRSTHGALAAFASRFNGKASPTQLFWHGFDLAHARYSGRRAPAVEGADPVTKEAYSHEVIAFGWWPGDDRRVAYPAFYSYTAPEPNGLAEQPLGTGRGRMAGHRQRLARRPALRLAAQRRRSASHAAGVLRERLRGGRHGGRLGRGVLGHGANLRRPGNVFAPRVAGIPER